MKKLLMMVFMVQALCSLTFGQMLNPTKWEIKSSKAQVKVGETVEIILTVAIDDNWHFYALGEDPPHATITFDGTGFEPVGKIKEGPGKKEKFDENLEMNVRYYDGKAEFRQTVKIVGKNPSITAEVEGQACPKGPGQCVRVNKTLEIKSIKVIASAEGGKVDSVKNNKPGENITQASPVSNKNKNPENRNVKELEAEKQKLISKDAQGNDETVVYLKNFVNKYGSKK